MKMLDVWDKEVRERMTRRSVVLGLAVLLVFGLSAGLAHADGMKLATVAIKKLPSIPVQQAVIRFKDGEERMTVYSSLDGEGSEFAWILPVPASPTKLEAVSPGFVRTLSRALQPKIVTDLPFPMLISNIFLLAILVPITAFVLLLRAPREPDMVFVVFCLFVVVVAYSFLGVLAGMTRGVQDEAVSLRSNGVNVEQEAQIGHYDVSVLDATTPDALNSWLEENGFQHVPEEGRAIVADYVDEGWRFVAAKLSRSGGGYGRPHPIEVTFPSDAPIYPMRLTALSGSELYLELMVIADKRARHTLLETDICDQFAQGVATGYEVYRASHASVSEIEKPPLYTGTFGLKMGHPGAISRMWDGCTVTKLTGTLTPGDMSEDFEIALSSPKRRRPVFFSTFVAEYTGKTIGAVVWLLGIILFMHYAYKLLWRKHFLVRSGIFFATLLVLFGLSAGISTGVNAVLPKTDDYDDLAGRMRYLQIDKNRPFHLEPFASIYDGFDNWTTEKVAACYQIELQNATFLPGYGPFDTLYFADEPGGLALEKEGDGTVFYRYDSNGTPWPLKFDQWYRASPSIDRKKSADKRRIRIAAEYRKKLREGDAVLEAFEQLRHGDDSGYLDLQLELRERAQNYWDFTDWSSASLCYWTAVCSEKEAGTLLSICLERDPSLLTSVLMEGLRFNYPKKVAKAARKRLEKLLSRDDVLLDSLYPDTVILMRITHEVPAVPLSRERVKTYLEALSNEHFAP